MRVMSKLLQLMLKVARSQYLIVSLMIFLIVIPSVVLGNVPFYHVDFVNEYASYMAHGKFMASIKNPVYFWWAYGPQIPVKIVSLFVPILKLFIKDEFILFLALVKINIFIQMLVAAFSMMLLAREMFGRNNVLNVLSALAYPLSPYFLSETAMYSARTWAYALAPLVPWIIVKYYNLLSKAKKPSITERMFYVLIGGVVFSITLFNPLDSLLTIGFPSLLILTVAILVYVLFIEKDRSKTLRYLMYMASSITVALALSLYFLYPLLYSYAVEWPFKETHFVSHHEEAFVSRYIPNPFEALQSINMEHKYHFTHIYPFKDILKYPSITHSLILLFLLGVSLFLLAKTLTYKKERRNITYFFYLSMILIGCITLYLSMNKALFEAIRNSIPLAFYLRRPHRLLIFWNIILSLTPAFIGHICNLKNLGVSSGRRHYSNLKSTHINRRKPIKKFLMLFTLTTMLIYMFAASIYAYTPPMSILANYEPIYSSYIKAWRSQVIRNVWSCLNMSEIPHKNLVASYTSGVHAFTYNYPGFTDAQDMLYWTQHYANTPTYADILSLLGIKYIISSAKMNVNLPSVCKAGGIVVRKVPINSTSRVYVGYPVLVIGGPNTLSELPYIFDIVGREFSHNLTYTIKIPIVPIYANSLSPEQFSHMLSNLNTIVFHNTNLLDLVALQALKKGLSTPIIDIDKPAEVERAREDGWDFFEPSYYGFLAPNGMHNSIYGQATYGNYVLVTTNSSRSLERSFEIKNPGTYVLMLRLGRFNPNDRATLNITVKDGKGIIARSNIVIHWLGLKWIVLKLNNLSLKKYTVVLDPYGKVYIDNVILILPENLFYRYCNSINNFIREKQVIYVYEP
ncbi:MAG: hypothetical protein ABWW65_04275, partial [Thermoprotei archaeon]